MDMRRMFMAFAAAICILFASLSAAGIVGNDDCTAEANPSGAELPRNPFEDFRSERNVVRQTQISQLNEMIRSGHDDGEIIALAQKRLLDLMNSMETETTLEGILKIRSFEDVIVSVCGESVSVFVKTDVLTQQQTAVILDLIRNETEFLSRNVKIIPIN